MADWEWEMSFDEFGEVMALCSYGLFSHGLYSYGLFSYGPI